MKIVYIVLASLVIFSGCSITDMGYRLRNKKQRAILYKQEQVRKARAKQRIRQRAKEAAIREKKRKEALKAIPKAPKKHITLKKVEDDNYSSDYMYPKEQKVVQNDGNQSIQVVEKSSMMTKEECVSIIGQVKYDTYIQKFGSESATLKRCKMLKAMK